MNLPPLSYLPGAATIEPIPGEPNYYVVEVFSSFSKWQAIEMLKVLKHNGYRIELSFGEHFIIGPNVSI